MRRRLAASLALLAMVIPVVADVLDRLSWSARPLLVLAPQADHPGVDAMVAAFEARRCETRDRDMVLVVLPESGPGRLGGEVLSAREVSAIRARYGGGVPGFQVVLVGKDGGAKLRRDAVPDLGDVFALIDGMPMRRADMRERTPECGS